MLDYDKCEGPDFVFDAHGGGLLEHAEIDPTSQFPNSQFPFNFFLLS
jgi:hypothetical protein